ncbi:hypothetical protein JXI42_14800 [bacterium]|nr:hypothetical protein [bacterium]
MSRYVLFVLTLLLFSSMLFAQVPRELSLQGKLEGTASPADMEVRLYDAETGGEMLWTETHSDTPLDEYGLFNLVLGEANVLDLDFSKPYWYEIWIDGESILGRIKATASPYSFHSIYSDSAGHATHSDTAGYAVTSGGGGACAPGGSDGNVQYNNWGVFDGSNQLHWHITNKRLGIGTNTPRAKLEISNIDSYVSGVYVDSAGWVGIFVTNSYDDGIAISSPGENGLYITQPTANGVNVVDAGDNGIEIDNPYVYGVKIMGGTNTNAGILIKAGLTDDDPDTGIVIKDVGYHGIAIDSAGSNGIVISNPTNNGLKVDNAGYNGVYIEHPGLTGMYVLDAGRDGIEISNPDVYGIRIRGTNNSNAGIAIFDAFPLGLDTGIVISGVDQDAIVIKEPGDDGISIFSPSDVGVHIASAGNVGMAIMSPDSNGVYINSPGVNGIEIYNPEVYGVMIEGGTNTNAGIKICDGVGTGDPDTGIVIRGPVEHGIYIDSVGTNGIKIRHTGSDGIRIYEPATDGISIYGTGYDGIAIAEAGLTGLMVTQSGESGIGIASPADHGIAIVGPGKNGVDIYVPDSNGVCVDTPGKDGVLIRFPGDDGVDVVDPTDNCFECNGTPHRFFRVSNKCEVFSHSYNQFIVDGSGVGYSTPMSATTKRWLEHIGESKLSGGKARIDLPKEFMETVTITESIPMQVFITPYGNLGQYTVERHNTYFVVNQISGEPNAQFAYKVHARIRGFENAGIEPVDLAEFDDNGNVEKRENR